MEKESERAMLDFGGRLEELRGPVSHFQTVDLTTIVSCFRREVIPQIQQPCSEALVGLGQNHCFQVKLAEAALRVCGLVSFHYRKGRCVIDGTGISHCPLFVNPTSLNLCYQSCTWFTWFVL